MFIAHDVGSELTRVAGVEHLGSEDIDWRNGELAVEEELDRLTLLSFVWWCGGSGVVVWCGGVVWWCGGVVV